MKDIFLNVLELSLWGSFLALFVIGIRFLTYKRLKKGLFYIVWIIVFMKFVVSIGVDIPVDVKFNNLSLIVQEQFHKQYTNEDSTYISKKTTIENNEDIGVDVVESNGTAVTLGTEIANKDTIEYVNELDKIKDSIQKKSSIDLVKVFSSVWFMGCIFILGIMIFSYKRGIKKLNLKLLSNDKRVDEMIDSSRFAIYQGNVNGPIVLGIIRPKIVLPMDISELDNDVMKYALIHEKQHLKWKDGVINLILLGITIIHWFNPVVWLCYFFFKQDLEVFCDERVIREIGIEKRTLYAEAIVGFRKNTRSMSPIYMLSFGDIKTKKRIKSILKYRPWNLLSRIVSGIILILVIVIFLLQSNSNRVEEALLNEISSKGYELIPVTGDDFAVYGGSISDGMMIVTNGKDSDDRRYGFVNTSGELVVEPDLKGTFVGYSEGLAYVFDEKGQGMYIDTKGNKVIDSVNKIPIHVGDLFKDGYAVVRTESNLDEGSYVMNNQGEVILEPTDNKFTYYNMGGGYFQKANSAIVEDIIGIVDTNGDVVFEGNVDFYGIGEKVCYYTVDGETFGIFSTETNEVVTKPLYIPVTKFAFRNNKALVMTLDGRLQIISSDGEVVMDITTKFSQVDSSKSSAIGSDRYAIGFLNNDNAVIIDGNGTLITQTDYNSIGTFTGVESDFAFCKKDGKYGYVDSSGKEVLEPIYDRVTNVENGRGFVTIGQDVYIFVWGQDIASESITSKSMASESIDIKEATYTLDQNYGVTMIDLVYASDERVIFRGYMGLFIYDLMNKEMVRTVDLSVVDCAWGQGSEACEVTASEDGQTVRLLRHSELLNNERVYIYDSKSNKIVESIEKNEIDAISMEDTYDVFGVTDDLRSVSTVKFDEDDFGYLSTEDYTLATLKYVRGDEMYYLFGKNMKDKQISWEAEYNLSIDNLEVGVKRTGIKIEDYIEIVGTVEDDKKKEIVINALDSSTWEIPEDRFSEEPMLFLIINEETMLWLFGGENHAQIMKYTRVEDHIISWDNISEICILNDDVYSIVKELVGEY